MKLLFVGDVMLGRLVNEALKKKPYKYPWGDTFPIFKQADLRICNLECVISDVGQPWATPPKQFYFRTDGKNIKTLVAAGIGMVSLANNHVLDYEYEGMFSMMGILAENAINYAGIGTDFSEAAEPAICRVDNKKVGLIAFTDNEPEWEATDRKPGIFYVPVDLKDKRAKILFEAVKKMRAGVDFLIISAHWGPNWGYNPPATHIPFAHALIDAGADIVYGHSGHIFRGVEFYKKKVILYCTGDFIDDYAVDEIERNDESFIFVIETNAHHIAKIALYPTVIRNFQARLAKKEEQGKIFLKMQSLCDKLGTKTKWQGKNEYLEVKL